MVLLLLSSMNLEQKAGTTSELFQSRPVICLLQCCISSSSGNIHVSTEMEDFVPAEVESGFRIWMFLWNYFRTNPEVPKLVEVPGWPKDIVLRSVLPPWLWWGQWDTSPPLTLLHPPWWQPLCFSISKWNGIAELETSPPWLDLKIIDQVQFM